MSRSLFGEEIGQKPFRSSICKVRESQKSMVCRRGRKIGDETRVDGRADQHLPLMRHKILRVYPADNAQPQKVFKQWRGRIRFWRLMFQCFSMI